MSVPIIRPSVRSKATAKGPIKPLQQRWLCAAEVSQQTAIPEPSKFLFGGCLRKLEPTKGRRTVPGDESPFTSDEEHLDSALAAIKYQVPPLPAATLSRLL